MQRQCEQMSSQQIQSSHQFSIFKAIKLCEPTEMHRQCSNYQSQREAIINTTNVREWRVYCWLVRYESQLDDLPKYRHKFDKNEVVETYIWMGCKKATLSSCKQREAISFGVTLGASQCIFTSRNNSSGFKVQEYSIWSDSNQRMQELKWRICDWKINHILSLNCELNVHIRFPTVIASNNYTKHNRNECLTLNQLDENKNFNF